MDSEELVPGVELLESMRSMGYSFEAAIADLVDNSLAAGATKVYIECDPDAEFIYVADNGTGMSYSEALNAMKLAGTAPSQVRKTGDLGRFGLGLKTASLSQGRKITLATKKAGKVSVLRWDLDLVLAENKWALGVINDAYEKSQLPGIEKLEDLSSGTLVIWEELDYFLGEARTPQSLVGERVRDLSSHLALVFHRFLDPKSKNRMDLFINGRKIDPIDPFLERNYKTQVSPVERIEIQPAQFAEVTSFTLPHPSDFSLEERKRIDLGDRMREFQGLYIYRNQRLISHGHWSGVSRREELTKQTRVRVDIPNTMDHLWQLDVRKSRTEPPQIFKKNLRRILNEVTSSSKRMYRFRGRNSSQKHEVVHVWNLIEEREGFRYAINRNHPAISRLFEETSGLPQKDLESILKLLADTFPLQDAYARVASNTPVVQGLTDDDRQELLRILGISPSSEGQGNSPQIEPFVDSRNLN